MANGSGYYQMDRGWMRNPIFGREPFTRAQAWIWMIEKAVWRDEPSTINGQTVMLRRGQFSHSIRYMARAWRWTPAKVQRFLKRLKVEEMIETTNGAARQLVVTVSNYSKYQGAPLPTDTPNAAENKVSAEEPGPPSIQQPIQQAEYTDTPSAADNKVPPGEPDTPSDENRVTNRYRKEKNSNNPLLRKGDVAQEESIAPPSGVPDPAALIFQNEPGGCLHYLIQCGSTEQRARKVLGNWRKHFGDGAVIEAMSIAARNSVSEPVAYITAVLKKRDGGAQHGDDGRQYSPEIVLN